MRHSPPVAWESSSAGVWMWAHALLAGLSVLGLTQSLLYHGLLAAAEELSSFWLVATWLFGFGLSGGLAWAVAVRVRSMPSVLLTWDGSAWSCGPAAVSRPGSLADAVLVPSVEIDLGNWLLVRVRAEGRHRNLWLPFRAPPAGAHPEAADWHLWRAALVAARPPTSSAPRNEVQA